MHDLSELSPLDREVLALAERYHVVTAWSLKGKSPEAAKTRLKRLRAAGWLTKPEGQKYYVLSARAARKLGLHRKAARTLPYEQRIEALVTLEYCLKHGFEKFTHAEFVADYPNLHRTGLKSSAYVVDETGGENLLVFILVDIERSPDRLVSKVKKLLAQRHELPEFSQMIIDYRFVIAIITTTAAKRSAIVKAVEAGLTERVVIRIELSERLTAMLLRQKRSQFP